MFNLNLKDYNGMNIYGIWTTNGNAQWSFIKSCIFWWIVKKFEWSAIEIEKNPQYFFLIIENLPCAQQ